MNDDEHVGGRALQFGPGLPEVSASTRRRAKRWLVIAFGLAILAVVARRSLVPRLHFERIKTFDLAAEVSSLAAQEPTAFDVVKAYYISAPASVHLHMMGPTQRCPLHLHPANQEITAILGSIARVSHAFGRDGAIAVTSGTFHRGDLIQSPAGCGHEWVNPSPDQFLGNLVITSPRFAGNLNVAADDARLKNGPSPTLYRLADAFASLPAESGPSVTPISGFDGRLMLVATSRPYVLAQSAATIVFVRYGSAALRCRLGRTFHLGPSHLAVLTDHADATIVPEDSGPVALLVLRIQ